VLSIGTKKAKRGPPGLRDPRGVSGYQVVASSTTLGALAPGQFVSGQAKCPEGKNVLGGGGNITSPVGSLWISTLNNVGTMWVVSFRIDVGVTPGVILVTWAICADVSS
jgi:hypothetical protein